MKRFITLTACGAMGLALAGAGFAQTADQKNQDPKKNQKNQAEARASGAVYVSADELIGAPVASYTDSERGKIDDLIVDGRDGRIAYGVLSTGGGFFMGIGDKEFVVPYGALEWNSKENRYTVHITAEQIKALPDFDRKNLSLLEEEGWASTMRGIFGERDEFKAFEQRKGYDEYTWLFDQGQPHTLNGKIVAVNRQAKSAQGQEYYSVIVQPQDTEDRRTILVAPPSYLTRQDRQPAEGDFVTINAYATHDADGESVFIAKSVRFEKDGETMKLRDDAGKPEWDEMDMSSDHPVYAFASDMPGGVVISADNEEFGTISEVVFEARSGSAAFAIVSVGGVMGIDAVDYAIPCKALSYGGDEKLYSKLPLAKLKLAPKLSKDGVSDLNSAEFAQTVRDYHEVKAPKLDLNRSKNWKEQSAKDSSSQR